MKKKLRIGGGREEKIQMRKKKRARRGALRLKH